VVPFAIAAMVGLALVAPKLFAQEIEPIDVLKVNTDLVVFDAQVIDKKTKRVIGDLTKDDFELSDNGARQQISYFSRDELPLSIMLLLDVSGSVRPILHQIRDGALNALQRLRPQDQVAVVALRILQDWRRTLLTIENSPRRRSKKLRRATSSAAELFLAQLWIARPFTCRKRPRKRAVV